MSGGSYDYLYCKDCDELFAYSNIRTLEEMESRFLDLGYEDVAKDFRRLIEYIKSANNRVEVLGGQLNEMMHDIEWYDGGDIGADTLAERVEKYRRADTPQNEKSEQMSKYDRNSRDVYAVKRLGDEIGYGHLMALAHELWAWHLEEKGLPREGAYCAVGYSEVKDEYQADAMNDPIYKVIVERALADTPQTEETCERCVYVRGSQWCQGCNGTPKRWDGEKIVDTPQDERSE